MSVSYSTHARWPHKNLYSPPFLSSKRYLRKAVSAAPSISNLKIWAWASWTTFASPPPLRPSSSDLVVEQRLRTVATPTPTPLLVGVAKLRMLSTPQFRQPTADRLRRPDMRKAGQNAARSIIFDVASDPLWPPGSPFGVRLESGPWSGTRPAVLGARRAVWWSWRAPCWRSLQRPTEERKCQDQNNHELVEDQGGLQQKIEIQDLRTEIVAFKTSHWAIRGDPYRDVALFSPVLSHVAN